MILGPCVEMGSFFVEGAALTRGVSSGEETMGRSTGVERVDERLAFLHGLFGPAEDTEDRVSSAESKAERKSGSKTKERFRRLVASISGC